MYVCTREPRFFLLNNTIVHAFTHDTQHGRARMNVYTSMMRVPVFYTYDTAARRAGGTKRYFEA